MKSLSNIVWVALLLSLPSTAIAETLQGTAATSLQPVYFRTVKIDGFWKTQFKRLIENWIPHCIKQMEEGGEGRELLNLVHTAKVLQGESPGNYTGTPWSDAYVYNTMEAMCLALSIDSSDDAKLAAAQSYLRNKMEQWIPIILAAQCDDGYIHSFHIVNRHPRYSNIRSHEFYVQGYFIEMGVAHYRVTAGKDRRLYEAAMRCADQLQKQCGPSRAEVWVYGHAGMGYALCRLARLVNEVEGPGRGDKYFQLAKYLLDNRHSVREHRSPYHQSHKPVVEMTQAVGHAVRATYFYTAMADLAMLTQDEGYRRAINRIWSNAIDRKHYITGGVGASHQGEAFSADFDLRNDGYCESCAGCGMTFWADRMHRAHHDAHFIDVQERTLYNNILGAVELTGVNFFYQNPLVSAKARYAWHGCPCCVGNIPRALLAVKDLMYAVDGPRKTLYVSHFVGSDAMLRDFAGTSLRITQKTNYPWDGKVTVTLNPRDEVRFALKIRIPDRTESQLYTARPDVNQRYNIQVNGHPQQCAVDKGYATVQRTWRKGDHVTLTLPLDVQRIYCDRRVVANRGRVSLIRGPIVYNVEDADHGTQVRELVLPPDVPLEAKWEPDVLGGVMAVEGEAFIGTPDGVRPLRLRAIPNYARLNRGGSSQVWITEDPDKIEVVLSPSGHEIKPIEREALDKRTVDRVVIGDAESEKRHGLKGKRTASGVFRKMLWRHAGNGWFSYEVQVKSDSQNNLLCTYWGSDVGNRRFTISVNGTEIAHQTLNRNTPDTFFDVEYVIPQELTQNSDAVTVRLQADPGATAGGIFDLRIVRPHEKQ